MAVLLDNAPGRSVFCEDALSHACVVRGCCAAASFLAVFAQGTATRAATAPGPAGPQERGT